MPKLSHLISNCTEVLCTKRDKYFLWRVFFKKNTLLGEVIFTPIAQRHLVAKIEHDWILDTMRDTGDIFYCKKNGVTENIKMAKSGERPLRNRESRSSSICLIMRPSLLLYYMTIILLLYYRPQNPYHLNAHVECAQLHRCFPMLSY